MLGELYKPKGLARETAQAVLEVNEPYAVNVALGCSNACSYCYVPRFMRKSRESCLKIRMPKEAPMKLVEKQLTKIKLPDGVFLSFLTDPFLPENHDNTEMLIELLRSYEYEIRIATSSKLNHSLFPIRHGMTIVSLDDKFWKNFEPNTLHPEARIALLNHDHGFTWLSMEPYPVSAIWKQDLTELLEQISFVDLIVFGKWNYDKRANTKQAKIEYAENIDVLTDFCKSNNIRLHIKSDTLKFVSGVGDKTKENVEQC